MKYFSSPASATLAFASIDFGAIQLEPTFREIDDAFQRLLPNTGRSCLQIPNLFDLDTSLDSGGIFGALTRIAKDLNPMLTSTERDLYVDFHLALWECYSRLGVTGVDIRSRAYCTVCVDLSRGVSVVITYSNF